MAESYTCIPRDIYRSLRKSFPKLRRHSAFVRLDTVGLARPRHNWLCQDLGWSFSCAI